LICLEEALTVNSFVYALTIVGTNAIAALVLAIVKDVINNVIWGETQLVLQRLSINHRPARTETPHLEISGRRAGLIGYLLTLFELSPKVALSANTKEIRKTSSSLHGHALAVVPLSESVSVDAESQRSLFWLLAALACLMGGLPISLVQAETTGQGVLSALAWVASAGIFGFAFIQSHRFQLVVHGTLRAGVSFKPGILDGRPIQFQDVLEAAEMLMERIHESRFLHGGPVTIQGPAMQTPLGVSLSTKIAPPELVTPTILPSNTGPKSPPASPYAPAAQKAFPDAEETLNEMPVFPVKTSPNAAQGKTPQPPERSNTGTVEYGEDQPGYEAEEAAWSGPEPGTSDSIQLRQSITRSATGMFLGVTGKLNDLNDEAELDDHDSDAEVPIHRGTVSWEDVADKSQDEMRAEAVLAELKRSRPKRGEAKFQLRDLMRRFPQTEAANKARRMLERLESGGQ
jgi:hypothetical protein